MKLVALAALACSACAATGYQLPMTSAQLSGHGTPEALVAYLGQADASPEVCQVGEGGPWLASDSTVAKMLVAALRQGRITPPTWGDCVEALLRGLDDARRLDLVSAVLRAETDLLDDATLESAPPLQAQLAALHRAYLERPPGAIPPGWLLDDVTADLSPRLQASRGPARPQLGPFAAPLAAELLEAIGLERGIVRGRTADAALVDDLADGGDEPALLRCARRLPDAALRAQAERRLVRLRIEASPFVEARDLGVEEVVMRLGANPVSTREHEPRLASLDPLRLPSRQVLVRQRPLERAATLLGVAPDRPAPSVFPEVRLRGALRVQLTGLSLPVTLCALGRPLDPTPCLAPSELQPGTPLARLSPGGSVRLAEQVPTEVAVALVREGSQLAVPLLAAGVPLAGLAWRVSFERPPDLILEGTGPGPMLEVTVERLDSEHLLYSVDGVGPTLQAVVERADAASFRVVSRGGPGPPGADGSWGMDGFSGTSGTSATCPSIPGGAGGSGSDGGSGGSGQAGGAGGRGGDVRVIVTAPASLLAETLALVRATVASEGGAGGHGGRGGPGGRGGRGGSGGMGATCFDPNGSTSWLPAGPDGRDGADGPSGFPGPPGPAGPPGEVRIEVR